MVKILMVHGFGANGAIFEAQTAPIRRFLPAHWEYHYLTGPLECGPGPGIDGVFPGQIYNCHFHIPSLLEFQSVHSVLEDVIEDEGPFDVAWGFSAGAMIIGSLMLRYEDENRPQPFRSAIFQNCSMPWSATESLGKDVTPLVIHHAYVPPNLADTEKAIQEEFKKHPTIEAMFNDERNTWDEGELIPPMVKQAYIDVFAHDAANGVKRTADQFRARRMFAELDKVRVNVPSCHILAEQDPLKELGEEMERICDPKLMLSVTHPFGHEVSPRSPKDLRRMAGAIEKTVFRSEMTF